MRKLLTIVFVWPALAWVFLPLLAYGDAATDAEIRQLQASIAALQQEQQSLYQQFQMTQELRRTETQDLNPGVVQNSPVYDINSPQTNFDDQERAKRDRLDRIQKYTQDLNSMYARYRALEDQKTALRARMDELMQPRTQ
jgi:cell division protein FtsB